MKTLLDEDILQAWKEIDPNGWAQIAIEIIDLFLVETENDFRTIVLSLEMGDCEGAQKAAHSLKSSFGNVGGLCGREICEFIEICAREGNLLKARSIGDKLPEVFQDTVARLSKYRDRLKTGEMAKN